ncbi:hypothetical protein [Lignipirellula cremea]|uniref:Uncharacterized protein n=1 Tax=Lignipirellula cremea TaxID=2528010 RepID=A0A518DRK9_9BACT|nr:hypothetical protein [Lignipirellula cremea]QDU94471.1 hypothetical protein Pla8534_22620 [Lignipirellula cremea]
MKPKSKTGSGTEENSAPTLARDNVNEDANEDRERLAEDLAILVVRRFRAEREHALPGPPNSKDD